MLKETFMAGPFEIEPAADGRYNINYGNQTLVRNAAADGATRQEVIEQLDERIGMLKSDMHSRYTKHRINLVREADGVTVASFYSDNSVVDGMSAGLIDDRHEYWLRSDDRLFSMPATINEYVAIAEKNRAASRAWIANLLPAEVLTDDPEAWRPPSSFELRHVVGTTSLTGVSGAKCAALVGVTAGNFRKYTAADGAKTRQSISFAIWHLLLQRLEITRPLDAAC